MLIKKDNSVQIYLYTDWLDLELPMYVYQIQYDMVLQQIYQLTSRVLFSFLPGGHSQTSFCYDKQLHTTGIQRQHLKVEK